MLSRVEHFALVLALIASICHCKLFDYTDTAGLLEQYPNAHLVNLSLPRPYGIYTINQVNPSTNQSMRVGYLDHNIISLRKPWSSVAAVKNVLAPSECELLIFAAEDYAKNNGGWQSSRHANYPTTDLPLKAVFPGEMLDMVQRTLKSALFPRYEKEYGVDTADWYVNDLFIAKYDGTGEGAQRELANHKDGSPWSFVVSLNADTEYEGGGTYFADANEINRVNMGHAVIFSGKNEHAGVRVTQGVRYILAGFVNMGGAVQPPAGSGAPAPDLSKLNFNMSYYSPAHDGSAAANGFVSGDVIVGLEKCEFVAAYDVSGTVAAGVGEQVLQRSMVAVDAELSDEEWRALASSCETLLPAGQPVSMVVSRSDIHL